MKATFSTSMLGMSLNGHDKGPNIMVQLMIRVPLQIPLRGNSNAGKLPHTTVEDVYMYIHSMYIYIYILHLVVHRYVAHHHSS